MSTSLLSLVPTCIVMMTKTDIVTLLQVARAGFIFEDGMRLRGRIAQDVSHYYSMLLAAAWIRLYQSVTAIHLLGSLLLIPYDLWFL